MNCGFAKRLANETDGEPCQGAEETIKRQNGLSIAFSASLDSNGELFELGGTDGALVEKET